MAVLVVNRFGSVDISRGVPDGWVHIPGDDHGYFIIPLPGIENYDAIDGFANKSARQLGWNRGSHQGGYWRPRRAGIVIRVEDAERVRLLCEQWEKGRRRF